MQRSALITFDGDYNVLMIQIHLCCYTLTLQYGDPLEIFTKPSSYDLEDIIYNTKVQCTGQGSLLFPKIKFFIKADMRGWSYF